MKLYKHIFLACALPYLLLGASSISAQTEGDSPVEACAEAITLFEENDIDGALEEARWCVESLSEIKRGQTLAVFPDTVLGFNGSEIESQSVLGMMVITRNYTRENKSIEVSLTGGGAAGSGLSALAQMGLDFAAGSGAGKKIRIQRRTVFDSSSDNKASFVVNLRSGGMLNFSSDNSSREEALAFIKAFPIIEIDDAFKNK